MEESRNLWSRLRHTANLEPEAFRAIAADREATPQAGLVVMLAGLCAGLGAVLAGRAELSVLTSGAVAGLVSWLVWSWFAYAAGVLLFRGSASYGCLLRGVGFAHGPLMLRLLRFIPGFGSLLAEVVALWCLIAGVVAVREALGLSTGRALVTMLVAWVLQRAVFAALAVFLGPFHPFSF